MNKTILLVEDSEDDVFFMQRAFKLGGIEHRLQVAEDGQAAIDYLEGKGVYAERRQFPWPDLILLDLRLPLVPGIDVLCWIRGQAHMDCLPVIVLSSSSQESDMQQCYRAGANSFLVKPTEARDLVHIVKCLSEYWLHLNSVPNCPSHPALESPNRARDRSSTNALPPGTMKA